jgi:hypothetical protein
MTLDLLYEKISITLIDKEFVSSVLFLLYLYIISLFYPFQHYHD